MNFEMEFKQDDIDDKNVTGEVTVALLGWLSILLAFGALAHWIFC